MVVVFLYEDKSNNPSQAAVANISELPAILIAATVQVTSQVAIESNLMLGILWPIDIYKAKVGEPPKHLVKSYLRNKTKSKASCGSQCAGNRLAQFK